jgi:hypothetical protein
VVQIAILNNISTSEVKEVLHKAVQTIVSLLPNKLDFLLPFLNEHQHYIQHLDKLKDHCLKAKLYNSDVFELVLRLVEYYLPGERNFPKAQKLLETMDEVAAKTFDMTPNLLLRNTVMRAAFTEWCYFDIAGALKLLEASVYTALKLKDFPEEQLMFFSRIAQTYLLKGDLRNAEKYSDLGKKTIESNQNVWNQDAFYLTRARIAIDKGDLEGASYNTKMALEKTTRIPGELPFAGKLPVLALDLEITIRKKLFPEALLKAQGILEGANKYIENKNHIYFPRVKILLGQSYLGLGKTELAKKEATESIKILDSLKHYKQSKYKLNALLLLADIYNVEGNAKEVQQNLLEAEKVANAIYTHFQIDDLSQMYKSLAKNSLALNEISLARHYFSVHKKYFGFAHPGTMELAVCCSLQKRTIPSKL